jgi:hypothetical protein
MNEQPTISRQRLWQIAKQKAGNCIICAAPRNKASAEFCNQCRIKRNLMVQTRRHGRKPIIRNTYIEFRGTTKTLRTWAEQVGITPDAMKKRLYILTWPLEKALTTPKQRTGSAI